MCKKFVIACEIIASGKKYMIFSGGIKMKGYNTQSGYMGYVDGEYKLFATEEEYIEYMEDIAA